MKAASKNNFYQQAIDELYRSAHTSNGMHRFVDFLRTHLPIDAFSLDILDSSNNAMENLIFIVQPETFPPYFSGSKYCSSISGIEPLSSVSTASPAVDIDSEDIDGTLYSSILMSLPFENGNSLRIKLYARGEQRYSNKHASQLLSLHYPLATAVGIMVKQSQLISNSRLDSSSGSSAPPIETKHIIGRDRGLKTVMDAINVVRRTDSSVLLMGETGTGKDIIASALHYGSSRNAGPFIKVNCGAIPIELVDSELFGHEKGSFTGAIQQKLGRFERADGGTLFLDEIGELSPQAQVRLLRTLQNREIERVGGTRAIPVNVRIICATNRNLQQMIAEGEFREDLWFRLNVFPIAVPPLRQRKEDIPSLASYFIEKKSAELRFHTLPELDSSSLQQLVGYNWPGNVRELENVIERALIIHQASPSTNQSAFVRFDALPLQNHDAPLVQHNNITRLKDFLADQFHKTLALTEGKIYGPGGAAEILNIHPDTLRHKMKRAGVHYGRNRNTGEE